MKNFSPKKFTKNINEYYFFPFHDIFDEPLLSSGKLVKKLGISGGFIATASWLVSKELVNGLKWIEKYLIYFFIPILIIITTKDITLVKKIIFVFIFLAIEFLLYI